MGDALLRKDGEQVDRAPRQLSFQLLAGRHLRQCGHDRDERFGRLKTAKIQFAHRKGPKLLVEAQRLGTLKGHWTTNESDFQQLTATDADILRANGSVAVSDRSL